MAGRSKISLQCWHIYSILVPITLILHTGAYMLVASVQSSYMHVYCMHGGPERNDDDPNPFNPVILTMYIVYRNHMYLCSKGK